MNTECTAAYSKPRQNASVQNIEFGLFIYCAVCEGGKDICGLISLSVLNCHLTANHVNFKTYFQL